MKNLKARFNDEGPQGGRARIVPLEKTNLFLNSTKESDRLVEKLINDYSRKNAGVPSLHGLDLFKEVSNDLGRFAEILFSRIDQDRAGDAVASAIKQFKVVAEMIVPGVSIPAHATITQIKRTLIWMMAKAVMPDVTTMDIIVGAAKQMDPMHIHTTVEGMLKDELNKSEYSEKLWPFSWRATPVAVLASSGLVPSKKDYQNCIGRGGLGLLSGDIYANTANPMFAFAGSARKASQS